MSLRVAAVFCITAVALCAAKPPSADAASAYDEAEKLRAADGQRIVDALLLYARACTLGDVRGCSELARACRAVSAIRSEPALAPLLTDARCDELAKDTCARGDRESCDHLAVMEVMRKSDAENAAAEAKARAARGPAHVVVDADRAGWRKDARVKVRVDGAPAPVDTAKPFVTIDVDDGKQKSRRIASVFPGVHYVVHDNPCAQWTLQATDDLAATRSAFASGVTTLRVDASALPAKWFPIAVTLGEREEQQLTLAAPGSTEHNDVIEAAMCMGAGVRVRVESRSSKKPLFDAVVIAHEGDASTLSVEGRDRWTRAVDWGHPMRSSTR